MLSEYIETAMRSARYEILADDGTIYGEIPPCSGVWANADSLEKCRAELQEVLEDWMLLAFRFGDLLPILEGIDLNIHHQMAA